LPDIAEAQIEASEFLSDMVKTYFDASGKAGRLCHGGEVLKADKVILISGHTFLDAACYEHRSSVSCRYPDERATFAIASARSSWKKGFASRGNNWAGPCGNSA
jgi:hypothetical protein